MRKLLKLEESLVASLGQYIKLHEQKIEFLHRQRDLLEKELKKGLKDDIEYSSNPLETNGFMSVDRNSAVPVNLIQRFKLLKEVA
uniref:Prolyl 4-hydroxylase N-terminal domain-containing protein n=1 Tax=Anopheles coluzzii TaxID=1518534 RepID=A0A8W7Q046_ANOCL